VIDRDEPNRGCNPLLNRENLDVADGDTIVAAFVLTVDGQIGPGRGRFQVDESEAVEAARPEGLVGDPLGLPSLKNRDACPIWHFHRSCQKALALDPRSHEGSAWEEVPLLGVRGGVEADEDPLALVYVEPVVLDLTCLLEVAVEGPGLGRVRDDHRLGEDVISLGDHGDVAEGLR